MTSDFENDEIKDSSFPIDLTDDTTSLDMYGVWVKSGPRDVSATPKKGEASSFSDAVSFTDFPEPPVFAQEESAEAPSARGEADTSSEDFLDIGNLPDLPDFPDMQEERADAFTETPAEVPETRETEPEAIPETIEFEDIVPITFEESAPEDASVPPKEREIPETSWNEASIGATETISLESFDTEPEAAPNADDTGFAAEPFEEVQFEDISFPAEESEQVEESVNESATHDEVTVTPETFESLETFERVEPRLEAIEPQPIEEAHTDDIALEDFLEPEITLKKPEEKPALDSEAEMELSLEDFMGPQEPSAKKESAPSDDDLSSFLDDLNASPAEAPRSGDSGDLDLDSLIDSVNEAGALGQEKENLFDDTEPLNIDLEFDESFIEESEKIRATGSAVSESEFFNSEFGVELVDETSGEAGTAETARNDDGMDFETLFQAAEEPTETKERAVEGSRDAASVLEETSEFDDLLQSLDAAPVPAPVSDKGKSAVPASKGFNLDVTEEDSMVESITTSVSESSSDEDFSVSLFGSETVIPHANKAETVAEPVEEEPSPSLETASIPSMIIPEDLSVPEPETAESVAEAATIEEVPSLMEEPISAPAFPEVEEIVDITQFKDYNNAESNPESAITEKASAEETVSLDFDDISAVEKDLSEENPVTGEDTVVTNDKSTELLMIIADELSSIKKEISTLKSEISGFKAGTAGEASTAQAPGAPIENSGFFSDDDTDETIALTGDELNNILITADFTEEKSDENIVEEPSASESPSVEAASVTEALAPEPTEVAEREPEIPETLPDTIFDVPGFEDTETIEAAHVNQITDDVSYLEGSNDVEPDLDNVAIEEPELETIDFDDEKLEEPELTEFNIDLTGMESGFPAEQEIAVSEQSAVEELAVPEETSAPEIEEFATTDTLSAQELAAVGGNIAPEAPVAEETEGAETAQATATLPVELKDEIKSVLSYMDQLLESLPEEKIEEFARSEHFEVYKKLFEELGIS